MGPSGRKRLCILHVYATARRNLAPGWLSPGGVYTVLQGTCQNYTVVNIKSNIEMNLTSRQNSRRCPVKSVCPIKDHAHHQISGVVVTPHNAPCTGQ